MNTRMGWWWNNVHMIGHWMSILKRLLLIMVLWFQSKGILREGFGWFRDDEVWEDFTLILGNYRCGFHGGWADCPYFRIWSKGTNMDLEHYLYGVQYQFDSRSKSSFDPVHWSQSLTKMMQNNEDIKGLTSCLSELRKSQLCGYVRHVMDQYLCCPRQTTVQSIINNNPSFAEKHFCRSELQGNKAVSSITDAYVSGIDMYAKYFALMKINLT